MRINPGGRLDIKEVVGRDAEIGQYWSILGRQGLVLSAERRIGKTHIVRKMQEEAGPGFLCFYQDLEGVHSVRELLRSVYDTVNASLSTSSRWKNRLAKWATVMPARVGQLDVSFIHAQWPNLLATALEDLADIAGDQLIVMMWDEFPLMLYNLAKAEGERVTIELLDRLRALRQQHRQLRFLFTGSVGLHLVLRSLRKAGNANDPTNDLYSITVQPLTDAHTAELTRALLTSVQVMPGELDTIVATVTREVGGFPYYVHHVIDQLFQKRVPVISADVTAAIDDLVCNPHDPAHLRNYRQRLDVYYDPAERALALPILDCVAGESQPLDIPSLLNQVRHRALSAEDDAIRSVLSLLIEDHYLVGQRADGRTRYDFRWSLVKRWWREQRL